VSVLGTLAALQNSGGIPRGRIEAGIFRTVYKFEGFCRMFTAPAELPRRPHRTGLSLRQLTDGTIVDTNSAGKLGL
jgi:hypothetical protein